MLRTTYTTSHYRKPPNYEDIKDIHLACKLGIITDVQRFLAQDATLLHAYDEYNNTPLYYSCSGGHIELTTLLSQRGARDDAYSRCFISALSMPIRSVLRRFNTYGDNNTSGKLQPQKTKSKHKITSLYKRAINPTTNEPLNDIDSAEITQPLTNSLRLGGKVQFLLNNKSFNCHLYPILCQWKKFASIYLFDNKYKNFVDKQVVLDRIKQIKENDESIVINFQDIRDDIFKVILTFIYSGQIVKPSCFMKNSDIYSPEQHLFYNMDETSDEINDVNDLIDACKKITFFELQSLVLDECMYRQFKETTIIDLKNHKKIYSARKPTLFSGTISFIGVTKNSKKNPEKTTQVMTRSIDEKARAQKYIEKLRTDFRKSMLQGLYLDTCSGNEILDGIYINKANKEFLVSKGGSHLEINDLIFRSFCDLKIVSSDEGSSDGILCHWEFLVWRSEYFRVALTGSFSEAQEMRNDVNCKMPIFRLDNCSLESLGLLMESFYGDDICSVVNNQNVVELLFLAVRFELPGLRDQCEEFILGQVNFDASTLEQIADLLMIADILGNKGLHRNCLEYIKRAVVELTRKSGCGTSVARKKYAEDKLAELGVSEDDQAVILTDIH